MTDFKDEEADVQEKTFIEQVQERIKNMTEEELKLCESLKESPKLCNHNKISFKSVEEMPKPIFTFIPDEKIRYHLETGELTALTINALNNPKNINKQAGRDYGSWIDIIALMREEIDELEQELIDYENRCFESSKRSLEELGDVGACGVLLLDWIKSREGK